MNVSTATERWLRKASGDRLAALDLAKGRGAAMADIVCFHCQQSAEKYIKAVLIQALIGFPKTHDLRELVDLAANCDSDLRELAPYGEVLAPFAVDVRYPDVDTDEHAMRLALGAMEQFRTRCLQTLGVSESDDA